MARDRPSEPRARLFVALDLPEDARERVVAWREEALAGLSSQLRFVPAVSLHLTLAFIGSRAEDEVEEVGEVVLGAVAGLEAAVLRPVAVAGVPPRRPRLFALDLEDVGGHAGVVQAAVSDGLEAGGFYTPEERPFWPHVTLARVKREARVRGVEAEALDGEFTASAVTLYRSRLSPRGASYEALARAVLSPRS